MAKARLVSTKTIVVGDYVFTPIKNQFNDQTAYWLSKKGYVIAVYCFTVYGKADLKQLEDQKVLNTYIRYFDNYVTKLQVMEAM